MEEQEGGGTGGRRRSRMKEQVIKVRAGTTVRSISVSSARPDLCYWERGGEGGPPAARGRCLV